MSKSKQELLQDISELLPTYFKFSCMQRQEKVNIIDSLPCDLKCKAKCEGKANDDCTSNLYRKWCQKEQLIDYYMTKNIDDIDLEELNYLVLHIKCNKWTVRSSDPDDSRIFGKMIILLYKWVGQSKKKVSQPVSFK